MKNREKKLTGIENSSAKYFNIEASLLNKLLRSFRLPWRFVSNSFLITEATESTIISLTFLEIISSSKDLILEKRISQVVIVEFGTNIYIPF